MPLLIVLLVAFLGAAAAPVVVRLARPAAGEILAVIPGALAVALLWMAPGLGGIGPTAAEVPWIPSLGVGLSLRLDGLAALFAVLVSAVGALVVIYAAGYLRGHAHLGGFYGYLLLFMAAMLGIVLADNLLLLYVFWELTTISSWLLIGFEHEETRSRRAAWQSLMVTTAGGLAMLAGFVLMGQAAGTYQISELLAHGEAIRGGALYPAMLGLVLAGAATKSALVPVHFWLPNAMAAPTPVSAYLHSAAMVKAGIYLLARFHPVLGETAAWTASVAGLGAVTAVVAAWLALIQTDSKRLLAYTTISALGLMSLGLGAGGSTGARAALALLLGHGLYKGALFMVAGGIDHGAGTRDLSAVSGLRRAMPWTAAAGLGAMVSMVGLPPTLGFLGEESLVEAVHRHAGWLLLTAAVGTGALYRGAGFVVGLRPWIGRERAPVRPHEPGWRMWSPPLAMAVAGIGLAVVPGVLDRALIAPAAASVAGVAPEEPLKLWHGVNLPFLLGMATLLVGVGLYLSWGMIRRAAGRLAWLGGLGPNRGYELGELGLLGVAARLDRWVQHGYLPGYLMTVLGTVLGLVGPPVLWGGWRIETGPEVLGLPTYETPLTWYDPFLLALLVAAALGAVFSQSYFGAVACMSIVGYTLALLFAVFGGPDLAITQVLVETLLVVLIALVLPAVPRLRARQTVRARVTSAVLSIGAGALVAVLMLTVGTIGLEGAAGPFYREHVAAEGGGNLVNAILMNFRATDTLGEVTVLSAAALGVLVLLGPPIHRLGREAGTGSQVLAISVRVLLPLLVIFAVFLLLIGHHRPGGGFAAALVLMGAVGLHLLGGSRSRRRELLHLAPQALLAIGLVVVLVSGVLGLIRGGAFLSVVELPWKLELLGGVVPGTPLLFDVGICLIAAGATFSILRGLEERKPWKS